MLLPTAQLDACGLPQRWRTRARFTVLDVDLGSGAQLAAVWAAWRADPHRCDRLHVIARHAGGRDEAAGLRDVLPTIEAHGLPVHALASAWPAVPRGMHRLELEPDRVLLTLAFGDADHVVRGLRCQIDAFLLGHLVLERNESRPPDGMLARQLARLAAPGATLAAASRSESLPQALLQSGFSISTPGGPQATGCPAKLIAGVFAPRWTVRRRWLPDTGRPETLGTPQAPRCAAIIGAGLAGTVAASALPPRGLEIALFEAAVAPARQASGNICGAFHPHVSLDYCTLSQLTRAGIAAVWREYDRLGAWQVAAAPSGVLQLASSLHSERTLHSAVASFHAPRYARGVSRSEASAAAGVALGAGGAWFARAGWARPRAVCELRLEAARSIRLHTATQIAALERTQAGWTLRDRSGAVRDQVPVVVLANAHGAPALAAGAGASGIPLDCLRGQLSYLPAARIGRLTCPIVGAGYLLPEVDGICAAGVDYGGNPPQPTAEAHARNLTRVAGLFDPLGTMPSVIAAFDPERLEGSVGFRTVASDRLPVAGALVDAAALAGHRISGAGDLESAPVWAKPRLPGLFVLAGYGSRGITWSSLMAEHLVALLEDEPSPMESGWADAVDPARFASPHRRRASSE